MSRLRSRLSRAGIPALAALLPGPRAAARTTVAFTPDSSQAQNVVLLGQAGGVCRAVALSGDRLFISQGARLTEVDPSDPARPLLGSSVLFPSLVRRIAASGDLVAVLTNGFWTIDARSTDSLVPAGPLQITGSALTVNGDLVFVVGSAPHFQVVDASDPARPRLVGTFDLPVDPGRRIEPTSLALQGDYAFLGYRLRFLSPGFPEFGGLAVLNLANPKSPVLAAELSFDTPVAGLALLEETHLYLILANRVLVVDVEDPRSPKLEDQIASLPSPSGIVTSRNRIYVSTIGGAVWGYLRDAEGKTSGFGLTETTGTLTEFAVQGNRLFVAGGWAGLRLHEFDETTTPAEVGSLTFPTESSSVAVRDGLAYVTDGRRGLEVFDLSDPSQPTVVATLPTRDFARGVHVSGRSLYVADQDGGVLDYDRTTTGLPQFVQQYRASQPVLDVTTLGDFVVAGAGRAGALLLREDAVGVLAEYGRFAQAQFVESVVAGVDRLYVADRLSKAIWVVDVSNPAIPSPLGLLPVQGPAIDVAFDGLRIGSGETDSGFSLFVDDGGPLPVRSSRMPVRGWVQALELAGNIAYLADQRFGLRVMTVLDPRRPSQVGFHATAGGPRGVTAPGDGRIYLAAGEAGLYVFRYTGAPDLAVTGFDSSPQVVFPGDEILLEGIVTNPSGVATPAGAWLDILVSEEPGFTEPRRLLCPRVRIEAGFGASDVLDLSQRRFVVLKIPDGVYRVGVVVDADGEVAELREDNNVGWISHRPIYVGPRPARSRMWRGYR